MKHKKVTTGTLQFGESLGGFLDGARAKLVRVNVGGPLVELLEDRGAYKVGDKVPPSGPAGAIG